MVQAAKVKEALLCVTPHIHRESFLGNGHIFTSSQLLSSSEVLRIFLLIYLLQKNGMFPGWPAVTVPGDT